MQHPWPYLFVRLSEIASCSAYGNKLFEMKLSPRTKEFLWLSTDFRVLIFAEMIHYRAKAVLKTCFCFSARQEEAWGLIGSC